jgi:hypothetical protein
MKECVALQEEYSFNGEKAFSSDLFPFPDKKKCDHVLSEDFQAEYTFNCLME